MKANIDPKILIRLRYHPFGVVNDQRHHWAIGIPDAQSRTLAISAGQRREPPSAMLSQPTNLAKQDDQRGEAPGILAREVRDLQGKRISETCSLTKAFTKQHLAHKIFTQVHSIQLNNNPENPNTTPNRKTKILSSTSRQGIVGATSARSCDATETVSGATGIIP